MYTYSATLPFFTLGSNRTILPPHAAPSIAPGNVEVIRLNGTAMNVSWIPLNLVEARGIVQGYIILYQQASSGSRRRRQMQMVQVDGSASYAIVGGLQPGVAYEVIVSGMTTQNGPGEFEWSMELEVAPVSHKILLTYFDPLICFLGTCR